MSFLLICFSSKIDDEPADTSAPAVAMPFSTATSMVSAVTEEAFGIRKFFSFQASGE